MHSNTELIQGEFESRYKGYKWLQSRSEAVRRIGATGVDCGPAASMFPVIPLCQTLGRKCPLPSFCQFCQFQNHRSECLYSPKGWLPVTSGRFRLQVMQSCALSKVEEVTRN